jgi:hypothetical protein
LLFFPTIKIRGCFKIILLSLAFISVHAPQRTHGFTTGILQKEDVMVLFEEPLNQIAAETANLYPTLKNDLEEVFGWKIDFIPTVVLFNDHSRFQSTIDSDFIVAYAVPGKNLMVFDYSKMMTDPFTMEVTLKHELCHLLLHRYIQNGKLPKWLDEGIAQWASGGLADILLVQKQSELDAAMLSGRYLAFRTISKRFPLDEASLTLAYEQSRSLVDYMVKEYGWDGLLQVLNYLKSGDDIEQAVQKAFSIPFEKLETKWFNGFQNRMTWLLFLANNIYEIIFFVASLALILGFIRAFIRKRTYTQDEEEDDV